MGSGGYRLSHKLPTKGGIRPHPEFSWTLQETFLGLTRPPSHWQERPLSGQCLQEAWVGLQGGEMVGTGTVEKADFLPL